MAAEPGRKPNSDGHPRFAVGYNVVGNFASVYEMRRAAARGRGPGGLYFGGDTKLQALAGRRRTMLGDCKGQQRRWAKEAGGVLPIN